MNTFCLVVKASCVVFTTNTEVDHNYGLFIWRMFNYVEVAELARGGSVINGENI